MARRTTDVIDEKSLERLRNLAEEMEGLAHRNFSDHGEEVELLAACNNDLHNIEASGNSRLQGVAERVAEVFLDLEASYWYGPHEQMLPILPDAQQRVPGLAGGCGCIGRRGRERLVCSHVELPCGAAALQLPRTP